MDVLLLPGIEGTGKLFRWFVEAAPDGYQCETVCYPGTKPLTCPEVADFVVKEHLPDDEFLIVAESYSGPVALLAP